MSFIFSAVTACSDLEMIEHKGVASIRAASREGQSIAFPGGCLLLSLCSKLTQALSNACDFSRAHLSIARWAVLLTTTAKLISRDANLQFVARDWFVKPFQIKRYVICHESMKA
jgi:hypothetical protein